MQVLFPSFFLGEEHTDLDFFPAGTRAVATLRSAAIATCAQSLFGKGHHEKKRKCVRKIGDTDVQQETSDIQLHRVSQ